MFVGIGMNLVRGGASASPASLFAASEPGVWYDPSDLTTLFQDNTGTTPVTAAGQTVGLMLDKSQGLALGSERLTNGDFSGGSTGWSVTGSDATHIATFSNGTLRYQSDTTTPILNVSQAGSMVVGKTYLVTVVTSAYTSGSIKSDAFGATVVLSNGLGTITFRGTASSTGFVITRNSTNVDITIDSISIKEIAGNHATQVTSTQRPIYGINPIVGTRNLLTYTEQFDNAIWTKTNANVTVTANTTTAPDGTLTADTGTISVGGTDSAIVQSIFVANNSSAYTYSFYVKRVASEVGVRFDMRFIGGTSTLNYACLLTWSTLTITKGGAVATSTSITDVGSGWYRISVTASNNSTGNTVAQLWVYPSASLIGPVEAGSVYLWGAQFETGSTATAYQKVVSQYEVTQAGVASASYIAFDGVDDGMVTPTITPAIDKAQVFAGLRKLSDTAQKIVAEMSATIVSNAGAFSLTAPNSAAANYNFSSKGTTQTDNVVTTYTAPITNVISGLGDIAGASNLIRVNGSQVGSTLTTQGTGNYLAYPLYIGRRGGSTLPYNGRIYSLIARFGPNLTTGQITSTESWVNGKTGAY